MIQLVQQTVAVNFQFAHTFQGGLVGDQRVANTYAQVTQHRGVSQVALPAGYRQLARHMLQHGIRQTQVTFGVFKVDWVHFVRHGGRTDFPGDGLLPEVVQGDVTPYVTIEVDQDGVEARNAVKQLGDVVVRLNLGGVWVPLDPERRHKLFAELVPVHFRVRGDVGVVVTHRAVDFAEDLNLLQLTILAFHAVRHVRHLFTHGGWGCWLAVSTGQQRNVAVFHGQRFHRINDFTPVREYHLFPRGREHQRVRQVVNILRRTGEVNKFRYRVQGRDACHFLFQEVFNCFHVVVGGAFDGFNARGIFFAELSNDFIKVIVCLCVKSRNFLDCCLGGQLLQPAYFNLNTELQQAIFAEDPAQRADFIAVASIDRGYGGQ